jgi:TRAP-type C4-dicarboxylate transport system substrate-binding protein
MPQGSFPNRPVRAFAAAIAVFALTATAIATADAAEPPDAWKLSVAVGPAFALGKAADRWAKLIDERSAGKPPVRLFPGATLSLRDPAREFIALRDGAADLAVGSTLFWSAQVPELNLIALPWLAPEDANIAALATGPVGAELANAVERAGVVPLALAALGHRVVATSASPPRSPDEVNGMKVRVSWTPLVVDLFVNLGAMPRSLPASDAQAAFRAGTLDAQEGTLSTIAAARLEAFGVKQVVLWGAVAECAVFAANRMAWNAWTEEQRALVRESAMQAARELPALVQAENDAALHELTQRGFTVTRLTGSGRAAFAAATRGIYDKWAARVGADVVRAAEAAVKGTP